MGIGLVSVLVAIAFLLGLALAVVLVRRQMAREDAAEAVALAQPVAPFAPVAAAPPPADLSTLSAREAVLANQLAALETRAAALTANAEAAGGQATRAEALLTAVAARRALDRGVGLGALDTQLQARFGATQPRAVALVRAAARQPVTLEDLRQGLDAIGPAAASGVGDGWFAAARRELGSLIVLRRASTPAARPADRLARARRLLQVEQVEAARAEVAQLPGADDAANWLDAARRYSVARQALDALENAALAGPPPVVPPVAPVTPLLP
jgi:hypothetical protein